ncbi:Methyl-accepting chemotaxis protein [Candidatus Terasakiella magnetica]|nr:Methyl-accepting chemotaxis protein [Candidatus Terasakiella magnetica]
MSLSNIRIFLKILLVVTACSLVTLVVAGTGTYGISQLAESLTAMEETSRDSIAATRLNQMALELNRTEFILASDPTPDSLKEFGKRIAAQRQELAAALDALKAKATPEQAELLQGIEAGQKAYLAAQDTTMAKVKEYGATVEVSEGQMIISEAAMTSSTVAGRMEKAVQAYRERAEKHSSAIFLQAEDLMSTVKTLMVAVTIFGTLGGFVLSALLGHLGIAKPMAATVHNLSRLAEGDTDAPVFGQTRKDEIGAIAATLQVFKQNILKTREMEAEAKITAERAARDKTQILHGLADSLESTVCGVVDGVSAAAGEMRANAEAMSAMSDQASVQANVVAQAAEMASTNVETVASAAEELTSSIEEISRQMNRAATVSAQAVDQASRTNTIVTSLSETADRIGEVVQLINDIAGQTNLLALNATIEAARAGEAGKGFAVVAGEVKGLANQTAKATDDISRQVASVRAATTQAVQAIGEIATTISEINHIATDISSAVEQQRSATQDIACNIEQAARGTQEVATNIVGVNHEAKEVGDIAGKVLHASLALAHQSEALRATVTDFASQVRNG